MDESLKHASVVQPKRRNAWAGYLAIAAGLAAAVSAVAISARAPSAASNSAYTNLGRGIENVQLIGDSGTPVRWSSLNGKPRALFFGYTHCPVICPVTVWELNDAMARIGPAASELQIEFVTLDSARDTPAVLHAFFSGFEGHVHAFSGEAAQIDRIARAYEVTYRRADEHGSDYSIDHTATVFLIDPSGRVVDVIGFGSERDVVEQRLRALLGAPAAP